MNLLPLVWLSPVFDPTGYADEARGLVTAIDSAVNPVVLRRWRGDAPGFANTLPQSQRDQLMECLGRPLPNRFVQVVHTTLDGVGSFPPEAVFRVGRSMFETDALPSTWVAATHHLDEIWVPSAFNLDSFRHAGVETPMYVVPGGVNSEFFNPNAPALAIPGVKGTTFLSVFEWRRRKGWDILLRAWAEAFRATDNVTLVIRSYAAGRTDGRSESNVLEEAINTFLRHECGRERHDVAGIVVIGERIPAVDLPSLYTSADVFVLPTRGEGWGRPFMESLACGVPVITTSWGAQLDFLHEGNSLLIDVNGLEPAYAGDNHLYSDQLWADPSLPHLVSLLRQAHTDHGMLKRLGQSGRQEMVADWPWSRAARAVGDRLEIITQAVHADTGNRRHRVRSGTLRFHGGHSDPYRKTSSITPWLEASQLVEHPTEWMPSGPSLRAPFFSPIRRMVVNSTVGMQPASVDILVPTAEESLVLPSISLPGSGSVVVDASALMCGRPDPSVIPFLRDVADRVVVPDRASSELLLTLGISPTRVVVLPPSADIRKFELEGAAYLNRPTSSTRFLAFGGAHPHRGLERLLETYEHTFDSEDDVTLHLVMQHPVPCENLRWRAQLLEEIQSRSPRLPGLFPDVHPISVEEMPAIFRSASVTVHAGRSLTHGRTISESMACGRPVIATDTPLARELMDDNCGWLVPQGPDGFADTDALAIALREACDSHMRHAKGLAARARAIQRYEEAASGNQAITRMAVLKSVLPASIGKGTQRSGKAPIGTTEVFPLDQPRRIKILVLGTWADRSIDRIVEIHARYFTADDDVSLAVCLDPVQGICLDEAAERIANAVAKSPDTSEPDILLIPDVLTDRLQDRLRTSCDAVAVGGHGAWHQAQSERARTMGVPQLIISDARRWKTSIDRLFHIGRQSTTAAP